MSNSSAAAPTKPAQPKMKINKLSLGDGKWLVLLVAAMLPGLYAIMTDSEIDPSNISDPYGCYSIYWFNVFFTLAVGVLAFFHALIWAFPRPVSTIDKSPVSSIVVGIAVGGPPLFTLWSSYILLWSSSMSVCDIQKHRSLWISFGLVTAAEAIGIIAIGIAAVQIVWQVLRNKGGVSPSEPAADSSRGTFTADPRANLDNGRWLTMESRRIKSNQQ